MANKSAWATIKETIVVGRPGTFGEQKDLFNAAQVFCAILSYLKEAGKEEKIFNADKQVTTALFNSEFLLKSGIVKVQDGD